MYSLVFQSYNANNPKTFKVYKLKYIVVVMVKGKVENYVFDKRRLANEHTHRIF